MQVAVLIRENADYNTIVVDSKHEGVERSRGIDNVICVLPEHEAMIRTSAFVRRISNFECAGDISPLVNPSSVGTRKDGPGRVKQLNVARFMLDKAASGRIGTYHCIPYYHSAVIIGSVRTGRVAR